MTAVFTPPPGRTDPSIIRNFCIIAHIDHGKSTLADRMLQLTGVVDERSMRAQYLDRMDIERERGITIKSQAVRMPWRMRSRAGDPEAAHGYVLNMIDTPGHVDFTYEVSRSLAACEGAVLLVDAAQGIEAQTLANLYLALDADLQVIPVLNKIDLPGAQPEKYAAELAKVVGCDPAEVLRVSAKTGEGVAYLLDEIVAQIPAPIGDPQRDNGATLLRVYRNLTTFLADHHISPTGWDYGRPDSAGNYADGTCITCWWRSPDFPAAYHEQAWPAKVVPSRGDKFVLERNWKASGDAFLRNVGQYWKGKDWIGGNSYLWVWDEPGNVHETTAIPAINRLVHKHVPGVKAFATAFPYERTKPRRLCKRFGNRACHVFPGVKNTNKNLWDGGDDDLDAWLIAAHRYYGKWTSGLERQYGIDRSLDAYRLQQKLRTRGKEVWSYTYFMPTQSIPQLTIDSPPTDRRLLMLWNAYERNTGWLTWHLNRWVDGRVLDASKAGPRNPYNDPIASKTPKGELANGDVSLMYPPVAAQYGLSDPTAPPVTSIRLEELRDGIEDVNLVTLYRERFGDAATRRAFAGIFGKVQVVNGAGYTWPAYSNTGLSTRMEQLRRSLVAALER